MIRVEQTVVHFRFGDRLMARVRSCDCLMATHRRCITGGFAENVSL
jgi:hypothetical protein